MIYVIDRDNEVLCSVSAEHGASLLLGEKTTDSVETGVRTILLTLKADDDIREAVKVGRFVLADRDLYTIVERNYSARARTVEVYGEDAGLDLLNKICGAYKKANATLKEAITATMSGIAGWSVIYAYTPSMMDIEYTSEDTATKRLLDICDRFGAELSYEYTINGLKLESRIIRITKKKGRSEADARVFVMGRDISNITEKTDVYDLATAYRLYGVDANGNRKALNKMSDYSTYSGMTIRPEDRSIFKGARKHTYKVSGNEVQCVDAMKEWANQLDKDGKLLRVKSYLRKTAKYLISDAMSAMEECAEPKVEYTVEFIGIPDIQVGDYIKLADAKGKIFVSARVLTWEKSAFDNTFSATIGNFKQLESSRAESTIDQLNIYTLQINSSNGLIGKDSLSTTLTATVYLNGTAITSAADLKEGALKWYRDGVDITSESTDDGFRIVINNITAGHDYSCKLEDAEVLAENQITLEIVSDGEGEKGDPGDTWKPAVSTSGDLTWSKDSGDTPPTGRNIKGPPGEDGEMSPEQLAQLEQASEDAAQAKSDAESAVATANEVSEQVEDLETRVDAADTKLTEIETDISDLDTRVDAAEANITTLNASIGEAQGEISSLASSIEKAQEDIEEVQGDISTLNTEVAEAQSDISTLNTEVAEAQSDISTLNTEVAEAQSDLETAKTNIAGLQDDIEEERDRAITAEQAASFAATQAQTAANAAGQSASIAQTAAEAALQSDYKDYGTRSWTDTQIAQYGVLGHQDTWNRTTNYYAGVVSKGQILIIHVTRTNHSNTVADLFIRADADAAASASVTGTVIAFGNVKAHFWHDNKGAHIVSDGGYRTDLDGSKMAISDISGNTIASFDGTNGIDFYKGTQQIAHFYDGLIIKAYDTEIAHLGYGQTVGEGGVVNSVYSTLGRRSTGSTIGSFSVAEGYTTTASGPQSHAEGYNTTASGSCSHAEGLGTTASGPESHAEGLETTASGLYSHAEGYETTASGPYSHAEGRDTTAEGYYSHAGGDGSVAEGWYSFAHGYNCEANNRYSVAIGESCITDREYQHVRGSYNAPNSSLMDVVGFGSSATNVRKNLYGLDSSGNGRFKGEVYVTCNDDSTGGVRLAKITEIPSVPDISGKVNKSGDEMTGKLTISDGGLNVTGRVFGAGDDEGIVVGKASNGYAGITLGAHNGERVVLYNRTTDHTAFLRHNNGTTQVDMIFPMKAGTFAMTSDIPDVSNYLPLTGGTLSKTESGSQDSILKIISNNTSVTGAGKWLGRATIGSLDDTFLMGVYNGMCGLGAHHWTNAKEGTGAAWQDIYINPDGDKAVYIGGTGWTKDTGYLKIDNANGGNITANKPVSVNGNFVVTGDASMGQTTYRNCDPNFTASCCYGLYQWDNNYQYTLRHIDNTWASNVFEIRPVNISNLAQGAVVDYSNRPTVNNTQVALTTDIPDISGKVNKSGDTMTGNLVVGSSSIGTNGYIQGTWLKTNSVTDYGSTPDLAILANGWIYKRSPAGFISDLGLSKAVTGGAKIASGIHSAVTVAANSYTDVWIDVEEYGISQITSATATIISSNTKANVLVTLVSINGSVATFRLINNIATTTANPQFSWIITGN